MAKFREALKRFHRSFSKDLTSLGVSTALTLESLLLPAAAISYSVYQLKNESARQEIIQMQREGKEIKMRESPFFEETRFSRFARDFDGALDDVNHFLNDALLSKAEATPLPPNSGSNNKVQDAVEKEEQDALLLLKGHIFKKDYSPHYPGSVRFTKNPGGNSIVKSTSTAGYVFVNPQTDLGGVIPGNYINIEVLGPTDTTRTTYPIQDTSAMIQNFKTICRNDSSQTNRIYTFSWPTIAYLDTIRGIQLEFYNIAYPSLRDTVNVPPAQGVDSVFFNTQRKNMVANTGSQFRVRGFKSGSSRTTTLTLTIDRSQGDASRVADTFYFPADSLSKDVAILRTGPTGNVDSTSTQIPWIDVKNVGQTAVSCTLDYQIPSLSYSDTAIRALNPNDSARVSLDALLAGILRGWHFTTATARIGQDDNPGNNAKSDSFFSVVKDMTVQYIVAPTGLVDSSTVEVPRARLGNLGNVPSSFTTTFTIGSPAWYTRTITNTLNPGATWTESFPSATMIRRGSQPTRCLTDLVGDMNHSNDTATGIVEVRVSNTSASNSQPSGTLTTSWPGVTMTITPSALIRATGTKSETTEVHFNIKKNGSDVYTDLASAMIPAGQTRTISVPQTVVDTGNYTLTAITTSLGDMNPSDDTASSTFSVVRGNPPDRRWEGLTSLPSLVSYGGWLTTATDENGNPAVYIAAGNKTGAFSKLDLQTMTLSPKAQIPPDPVKSRFTGKGASGVGIGDVIYATVGNSTTALFQYVTIKDSWRKVSDVPLGPSGKKVKDGSDLERMTINGQDVVGVFKGQTRPGEFYTFNPQNGTWEQEASLSTEKWRTESSLAFDGTNIVYAFRSKVNEIYAYDIAQDSWHGPSGIVPFIGNDGRKKKAGAGLGLVYLFGRLFAQKGNNTYQFWEGNIGATPWEWSQLADIPLGSRKPKQGGDLVAAPNMADTTSGGQWIYSMSGNKTGNMNRYGVIYPGDFLTNTTQPAESRQGVQAKVQEYDIQRKPIASLLKSSDLKAHLKAQIGTAVRDLYSANGRKIKPDEDLAPGVYFGTTTQGTTQGNRTLPVKYTVVK